MPLNSLLRRSPTYLRRAAVRELSSPSPFCPYFFSFECFACLSLISSCFLHPFANPFLPCSRSTNGEYVTMTTHELSVTYHPFPSLFRVSCTCLSVVSPVRARPRRRPRCHIILTIRRRNTSPHPTKGWTTKNETWHNCERQCTKTSLTYDGSWEIMYPSRSRLFERTTRDVFR